jgi:hypothetical protein
VSADAATDFMAGVDLGLLNILLAFEATFLLVCSFRLLIGWISIELRYQPPEVGETEGRLQACNWRIQAVNCAPDTHIAVMCVGQHTMMCRTLTFVAPRRNRVFFRCCQLAH